MLAPDHLQWSIMTPKFVKPILIDNGNDLSTLPFNSDISREKVDCGFNKSSGAIGANF